MYSVVIPTYNSTRTIQKAIESVLIQTMPVKKIYIIDDFSDDINQLKCILGTYGSRICLVENTVKTNAANNRNRGWELVQEEFVFFLDSDDEWLPFHAEEVIKCFNTDKLLDCVCTAFFAKQINGNSYVCNSTALDMKQIGNPLDLFFTGQFDFRSSCVALKKEIYGKVKFDASLNKHQDWDLFLSLVINGLIIDKVTKPTVQINEWCDGRMSAKNNLEASFIFIEKWMCYQNEFNFNRLFKMFYVSAFNNSDVQEIKLLNSYVRRVKRDIVSNSIRILSFASKLSFYSTKLILLLSVFVFKLKKINLKFLQLRLLK